QVEAFWSNSEKNGVVRAKITSTRSTERAPSTASSGCTPRARSSCIQAPPPTPASSTTSATQNEITKPREGMRPNEATASATPIQASHRPALPCPGACASSAVRMTREKACWSTTRCGGTSTERLRPSQNTRVATNISRPGMPNDTEGPKFYRNSGISNEANSEPKLMIQ